ncbi:MAG: aminotransferase class I/II-fold pyridoxal phosphate-dependent enzyme, partial [Nitrospinota bacterium]|nr:aminotransferase class I/II-fold pyridoxal phosphate-dependent enzyme [Nitrospinota bacterium]
HVVRLLGARPVLVPHNEEYHLDVEAVRAAITDKTRLVLFCNPNNPTGVVYKREDIKALVEQAGGSMENLVKITVYLTDIRHAEGVRQARNQFIKGEPPTSTLLVVTALASPDFLVEIDAVAVLSD